MKVVIGGGGGLVGQALARSLAADGHEPVVLTRRPSRGPGAGRAAGWETAGAEVDGAAAVVNLAGVSIGGPRWTKARKAAILASRVDTNRALVRAVERAGQRPAVFVSASGVDYYGASGDEICDESSPAGATFLSGVCEAWEAAAAAAPVPHVAVRTALAVGRGAQAIRLMALPYRFFAGGPLGGGRQWFPGVQLDDLVAIYRLAIDGAVAGPVNAVAPEQLRQRDAARIFGAVLRRPAVLPTPAFALRLVLGEQADLLLHGQNAVSKTLGAHEFRYRGLRAALEDALGRRPEILTTN
jgi:uncharacterized protein (TIGR01777 family)